MPDSQIPICPNTDNSATDLYPVREESAGAVSAGEELLHVLLPDQAEAVPQALLLCNNTVCMG